MFGKGRPKQEDLGHCQKCGRPLVKDRDGNVFCVRCELKDFRDEKERREREGK